MASRENIIERHQQLYQASCSSMAVELVLKLHKLVGSGYRKIQDCYRNKNVGFGPFRDHRIRGLYFYERAFNPPFAGVGNLLQSEIQSGRFPIISFWSGEEVKDGRRLIYFHEWVVIEQKGGDFHAVSKHFRKTIHTSVSQALAKSPHTSLLLYQIDGA